jgi:hypothetical protein
MGVFHVNVNVHVLVNVNLPERAGGIASEYPVVLSRSCRSELAP